MRDQNGSSLKDLQTVIEKKPTQTHICAQIGTLLDKELHRKQTSNPVSAALNRARSHEREQASPLRKQPPPKAEESELVSMLKRKLQEVNQDKEKIRNEMIAMASLLDQKEAQLRTMQIKLDKVRDQHHSE